MTRLARCPECEQTFGVKDELAGLQIRCRNCLTPVTIPKGKVDYPWTPTQVCASAVLFGPLGCGVIAGINFGRLGRRAFLVPCVLAGFVLFLAAVGVASVMPAPSAVPPINLGIGALFLLLQKSSFDAWKVANWAPAGPGERYRPNRTGQLFLVGLGCVAVELAVVALAVFAGLLS